MRLNDPLVCKIHLYVIFKGYLGTVYNCIRAVGINQGCLRKFYILPLLPLDCKNSWQKQDFIRVKLKFIFQCQFDFEKPISGFLNWCLRL